MAECGNCGIKMNCVHTHPSCQRQTLPKKWKWLPYCLKTAETGMLAKWLRAGVRIYVMSLSDELLLGTK